MGCTCAKTTAVEQAQGLKGKASKSPPASTDVIAKKVAQAKSTRVLALRECGLKQLPPSATAAECSSLRTIDLTGNSLKSLPEAIGGWKGLQNLLCAQNALTELPESIGQLVALQRLALSENRLRALPVELSQLGKLKTLQLEGNGLTIAGLPEGAFCGALSTALEELDLSGNALEELPESLGSLSALQRLAVARNRLHTLPASLGRLGKLQHLDLADNLLASLPDGFLVKLSNLSELWLKGNPIDRIRLQEAPGFNSFLERRKERLDAKIGANVVGRVDLSVCGLD